MSVNKLKLNFYCNINHRLVLYISLFLNLGFIDFMKTDLSSKTTYPLSENYFNPERYEYSNGLGMEQILQGLVTQKAQKCDKEVSSELTNKLFPQPGKDFGGDLVARYI